MNCGPRTADATDAVARARSRLQDIVNRFEDRAAAIEARLDEPGAVEELREEARRALDEAIAVVDGLRTELDGHAADVAAPTAPAAAPAGAPAAPAGFTAPAGLRRESGGDAIELGRHAAGAGVRAVSHRLAAELAALPLPDPEQFGDGVAVTLPDGSTVMAPNPSPPTPFDTR